MRKLLLLIVLFLLCNSHLILAQNKSDSSAIKNASLDYIEGYFEKDAKRVKRALHPELIKRTLAVVDSSEFIYGFGATYMIFITKTNENEKILNPNKELIANVDIFDISGNAASVKITTNQFKFIDYLHLCKIGGEWKIINVFWIDDPEKL